MKYGPEKGRDFTAWDFFDPTCYYTMRVTELILRS
jgi:hypothetical protein